MKIIQDEFMGEIERSFLWPVLDRDGEIKEKDEGLWVNGQGNGWIIFK